jgi:hypothetical protein
MKPAICCFLLVAAGVCAQSTGKLNSDLMKLAARDALAQEITDDILALAQNDAQPSRQTVFEFADEFTKALARKQLAPEKIEPVTQAIQDVLQSSGLPSYRFRAAIDRFRDSLIALDATAAQAKSAAGRLLILGQEVRGPEDINSK